MSLRDLTTKDVFTLPPAIFGNDRVGMTLEHYDRLTARNAELVKALDLAVSDLWLYREHLYSGQLDLRESGVSRRMSIDALDLRIANYRAALKEST